MNDVELPQDLKTSVTEEKVQVPIDVISERSYTREQLERLQAAGGIVIGRDRLQALHAIGVSGEQLGILRLYKGGVLVGLNAVVVGIQKAESILNDETDKFTSKEKNDAGRLLGYLAGQLSKLTSGAVKMDRDVAEVVMAADEKRRQSFPPGQRVTINRAQDTDKT